MENIVKNIYLLLALVSLEACIAKGLDTEKLADADSGMLKNEATEVDDQEKSACEVKGGYYSTTLGCFE